MPHSYSSDDSLDRLAHEFAVRLRRGECPAVEEYVARRPDLAEAIRALFPTLAALERLKPADTEPPDFCSVDTRPEASTILHRLGDYRILREVGRGGMGIVYEAVQESLSRPVALKILPGHARLTPNQLERFRREARAAARLHHTNIVPVFGVGEDAGVNFYAMQYIHGQGLDRILHDVRRLRAERIPPSTPTAQAGAIVDPEAVSSSVAADLIRGRFTGLTLANDTSAAPDAESELSSPPAPAEPGTPPGPDSSISIQSEFEYFRSIARVGIQVAEALAYAHRQGILHRDIKPSNLLMDVAGTAWIADFGLAKDEDVAGLTESGDLVGTLRYMAPERYEGRADRRSDIYSLGVTLYELLTLRPAYDGDRARVIARIRGGEDPEPARARDARIPRDLETIVTKASTREPEGRYQDATELAEDLRRFLEDRPIRARRVGRAERAWRWCRRNPVVATLTTAVVMLLAALAVGTSLSNLRLRVANDEAIKNLWQSYRDQAEPGRWSGRPGQRLGGLEAVAKAARLAPTRESGRALELRNQAIACLALPDLRTVWKWRRAERSFASFDAVLGRYALKEADGTYTICRVSDDTELLRLPGARGVPGADMAWSQFSPNGRWLAVEAEALGRSVRVWDLETHRVVLDAACYRLTAIAFSPDAARLAVVTPDGGIEVFELATGRRCAGRFTGVPDAQGLSFSPDGRWLAVSNGDGVRLLDAETGRAGPSVSDKASLTDRLAWSPDGRLVASGGANFNIYVWDVQTGRRLATLQGHSNQVTGVAFHPRGGLLVSTGWDGTTRLWDLTVGRQVLVVDGSFLSMSDDGRRLAYAHDTQRGIWELVVGAERRGLPGRVGSKERVYPMAFHPGGRLVAYATEDGVRLGDAGTGQMLAHLPIGWVVAVLFNPKDGHLLTYGKSGLWSWPVRAAEVGDPRRPRVGPPRRLGHWPGADDTGMSLSNDGRTLAVGLHDDQGQRVVRLDLETMRALELEAVHPAVGPAVSPDGRWVAAGSWGAGQPGARVWDAQTGKLRVVLPSSTWADVAFSPDGLWLVVGDAAAYQFYETGSWLAGPALSRQSSFPGDIAFSPDGRVCAVSLDNRLVRLFEVETLRELASLQGPADKQIEGLSFSPDGRRLAVARHLQVAELWDLGQIQSRLREMGLGWESNLVPSGGATDTDSFTIEADLGALASVAGPGDAGRDKVPEPAPDGPEALVKRAREHLRDGRPAQALADLDAALAADADSASTRHHRAHALVSLGRHEEAVADFTHAIAAPELSANDKAHVLAARGRAWYGLGRHTEAVSDFEAALAARPDEPGVRGLLAWLYAVGPELIRNPERAADLAAQEAVGAPSDATARALGAAHYRNRRFREAADVLGAPPQGSDVRRGHGLLVLAMARHRLGDAQRAAEIRDQAEQWWRSRPGLAPQVAEEYFALRAEADAVLKELPQP